MGPAPPLNRWWQGAGRRRPSLRNSGASLVFEHDGDGISLHSFNERMTFLAVFVEFMDHVVCHTCILSVPKEMAERIRRRIPKEREEWVAKEMARIAKQLEKAKSILDIEGGVFALAIAKVYEEEGNRRKARKGKEAA